MDKVDNITIIGGVKDIEHEHQKGLIEWAHLKMVPPADDVEVGAMVADLIFAIPNGGARGKAQAGRLKAEGVKAGVWDLMLPLARQGFHGLWIEMKALPNGRLSKEQKAWGERMRLAGYRCEVAWTWDEARRYIVDYLEGKK